VVAFPALWSNVTSSVAPRPVSRPHDVTLDRKLKIQPPSQPRLAVYQNPIQTILISTRVLSTKSRSRLEIIAENSSASSSTAYKPSNTIMPIGQEESGISSGVKFVTSTVGNTVGGVTNTVGGVVGALGRGVGETLEGATGSAGR
jgi:hypothetical protein